MASLAPADAAGRDSDPETPATGPCSVFRCGPGRRAAPPAKVWKLPMYPTNTLGERHRLMTSSVLAARGLREATVPVGTYGAGRTRRPVGMDAGAETGPYAIVTDLWHGRAAGPGRAVVRCPLPKAGGLGPAAGGRRRDRARDRLGGVRPAAGEVDKHRQARQPAELPLHDRHEPGPRPLAQDGAGAPRLHSAAAGTDPEPYSDPSQDVDIRELRPRCPPGCASRSCCTTTPGSASGRSPRS